MITVHDIEALRTMSPILTNAERRRENASEPLPRAISSEEIRMRLSDEGRRLMALVQDFAALPYAERAPSLDGAEYRVTPRVWIAAMRALIAAEGLAAHCIEGDVDGR